MRPLETRHSLIIRLKSEENEPAWNDFVVHYESFLRRLCVRLGVPEQHIGDVVQQILLVIAKSIEGWSDDGREASFRRWLTTVSRNVVIRFMSAERKQVAGSGGSEVVELLANIPSRPNEDQVRQYEHELIVWAAEQIRSEFIPSSWKAFHATIIEQRPVDEVAADLQVPPGSIYMSRSGILARIKAKIEFAMKE